MPYRTFFCYANSTQEAEEWIKILQWKLVSLPCIHLSHIFIIPWYNSYRILEKKPPDTYGLPKVVPSVGVPGHSPQGNF